jgi:ribosomal protein RSM22 (predicted rRNA methylase)
MARKPNYKFEKLERERQKAAKKAAKQKAKQETEPQKDEDAGAAPSR